MRSGGLWSLIPNSATDFTHLGHVLREQGKMEESAAAYERALALDPDKLQALLGACLMLPPIYSDREHVVAARQRYAAGLKRLREEAERFRRMPSAHSSSRNCKGEISTLPIRG